MKSLRIGVVVIFAVLLSVSLTSCGGGGGSSGGGSSSGGGDISISGKITFDFVPDTQSNGLSYLSIIKKPSRGVIVEAIRKADSAILDSANTDSSGNYTVIVSANTDVVIRVKAQMLKTGTPSWNVQIVDNTHSKSLYVMDSAIFNSGTANIIKDLNASSGWGGLSYTGTRVAAPFAILDIVYQALSKIIVADPSVTMPQLLMNWSVNNVPTCGNKTLGQICTTYYDPDEKQIYILGKEDNDTDEYDDHVIAHEWAHYFEDRFSRSDSIGGSHASGNKLDFRVAFSEGFGNAFSGMATDNSSYIDTCNISQATTCIFNNLEDNNYQESSEGWFSKESVQIILYDLYDSSNDSNDTISLGFSPIYNVLVNKQKNANSFTTIFSFISFLKENNPGIMTEINNLVGGENISIIAVDEWDSTMTETNDGGNPKSLPVHKQLTVGSPAVQLCGSGYYGDYNKFMNRKVFYFYVTLSGNYTIKAVPDSNGDPVIDLYSKGEHISNKDTYSDGDTETLTVYLSPGYYVGEVYDYCHAYKTSDSQWCNTRYSMEECFNVSLN